MPLPGEFDSFDLTSMHVADQAGFQQGARLIRVHPRSKCEGRGIPCCIHDPSGHHMRTWDMNWRSDTGVMERFCRHGIGHPDPDHLAYIHSLTPPHPCIDEFLRMHPEYLVSIADIGPYGRLCKYVHLDWQGVHGCDGCCIAPGVTVE